MTNFSDMLSKAKAMQEKMKEAQDQIKKIEVEGVSGGDLVKVVLFGDYEIKKEEEFSIDIKEEKSTIQSEIDDILNEYDEDNFGSFDELDEDLY